MYYTLTIGLSAFLLFLIQPLISKMLLPWFGGGASIWITSLVFFQTVLLIGYGTTHFMVRRFGLRRHIAFTGLLLVASLAFLPISASIADSNLPPSIHLFVLLAVSVGLPYLTLTTTSPTLQYWMANDTRAQSRSPYIQYGISNLGSLTGLLAFPFFLEFFFTSTLQSWIWTTLYVGYAVLLAVTIMMFLKHNAGEPVPTPPRLELSQGLKLRWVFQAMVPSALLLVITHYLTIDVVNLPLLWVAPLCVYLITFIVCFLFPAVSKPGNLRTLLAVGSILVLMVTGQNFRQFEFGIQIAAGLACLFFVAMVFHGDLERGKPHKQDLTDFYLQVSAGGCLGSIAAGIVAPLLFDSMFEIYVVIVIALYYLVATRFSMANKMRWLLRGAIATSIVISWLTHETGFGNETIYQARSFYSAYAIREDSDHGRIRRLVAGTHVHGAQFVGGPKEHVPLVYYHRRTGVARMFEALQPAQVGAIGLGVGSIVEYGSEGMTFDLFELDPLVVEIAKTRFTVLSDSSANLNYFVGDGRLQLRKRPDAIYDLLILDAFTSGSIPTHLVTLEAVTEMLRTLKPGGGITYHISNHHVDLLPVLNGIAQALDLEILYHLSPTSENEHLEAAVWVTLTKDKQLPGKLIASDSAWREPPPRAILWHDGYSNIWAILK